MENKDFIVSIEIPLYIREIITSNARRPKFYEKESLKKELPKKFKNARYDWESFTVVRSGKKTIRHFLVDVTTNEKVIANPRVVGKPKTKIINGQDLHRLTLPPYLAASIKEQIKRQFSRYTLMVEPIDVRPLIIECELFDTFDDTVKNNKSWDVDNRFLFYGKVFLDVLTGCPKAVKGEGITHESTVIIPSDDRSWVTGPPSVLFTPVETHEERKLVFKIYHDKREIFKKQEAQLQLFNKIKKETWRMNPLLLI